MRVVNRKVAELIRAKKTGKASANTEVVWSDSHVERSSVYLFGKHIATYNHTRGTIHVNMVTFWAWPTATTADRLNGLFQSFEDNRYASIRRGHEGIWERPSP